MKQVLGEFAGEGDLELVGEPVRGVEHLLELGVDAVESLLVGEVHTGYFYDTLYKSGELLGAEVYSGGHKITPSLAFPLVLQGEFQGRVCG